VRPPRSTASSCSEAAGTSNERLLQPVDRDVGRRGGVGAHRHQAVGGLAVVGDVELQLGVVAGRDLDARSGDAT
jgi:hypothetical protein